MQAGYFQTAWNDIKHSDGWAKKIALLALLQFIPIFGQIVAFGYLFAWARDIAWNIHAPLPERIFGNEDGKLYSRGFFALVIAFVFSLIPGIISSITSIPITVSPDSLTSTALVISSTGSLFATVLALAFQLPAWVGQMRSSIYGRIGPGFQLQQIWKMMKYDTNGLLRILGMVLLIGVIMGTIYALGASIFGFGAIVSILTAGTSDTRAMAAIPVLGVGSIFLLALTYALMFGSMWLQALECRALGYWTRQFNVPAWGGQDDPLPFETSAAARQAQQAQYAAQVQYTQAQAEAAQVQGQKIEYQNQQAQQQYAQAEAQAAQAVQQDAQVFIQPAAPVNLASAQPAASTNSPDWIAQANASAPTEQRSPYTAPVPSTSAEPAQPQSPFEAPCTSVAQPESSAAAYANEVAQSADNLASKAYGVVAETTDATSATPAETTDATSATPAEPTDATEANKGAGLE